MTEKVQSVGDSQPSGETAAGSISIDDFVALNDELAAIVRAGMPLEYSLRMVGRDMPGNLGAAARSLASRLSGGETLPQALSGELAQFPAVYRAVVAAGLRAGRLPAALEGLASLARGYADLRRAIGLALVYPLVVLSMAYGLFVFFVMYGAPEFFGTYEQLRIAIPGAVELFARCKATLPYWGPILPVCLALVGVWWFRVGRVRMLEPAWSRRMLGWFPWVNAILKHARAACFADLLALLLEHRVPLAEAIVLSVEATGDRAMIEESHRVADALSRGESPRAVLHEASTFPPMLRWLIVTGLQHGSLANALRHAAQTYRELSLYRSGMLQQFLPVALLVSLGGTAVFIYCLLIFVPFTSLLLDFSSF